MELGLQVGTFEFQKKKSDPPRRLYDVTTGVVTDVSEVEDSDYEIDYFQTPNKPPLVLPVQTRTKKSKKKKQHKLQPVSIHLLDIRRRLLPKMVLLRCFVVSMHLLSTKPYHTPSKRGLPGLYRHFWGFLIHFSLN